MRTFYIVDGGVVAEGCRFGIGKVIVIWMTESQIVAIYDDLDALKEILPESSEIVWI